MQCWSFRHANLASALIGQLVFVYVSSLNPWENVVNDLGFLLLEGSDYHKVNRCLAPQPPTNRAPNEPKAYMWYVPEKAYFGANMAVFRPNILFFLQEEAKVLVHTYHKANEAPRSHCFIGWAWHQMDQIGQYLAQNDQKCIFGAKFGRFWAKTNFLFPRYGSFSRAHPGFWPLPELRRNGRFYVWPKSVFCLHIFAQSWPELGVPYEMGFFWARKLGPQILLMAGL